MRIGLDKVNIKGEIDDVFDLVSGVSAYRQGTKQVSKIDSQELFSNVIQPLYKAVSAYRKEFDSAVNNYIVANNMMTKMKDVLSPADRKQEIDLTGVKINNKKQETQNLKYVMDKGHELLLKIRQALTGQDIITKFVVQYNGRTFYIDESKIPTKLVFSKYGGGTISNPFSLAYQIDLDMNDIEKFLETNGEEIGDTFLWKKIYQLKRPYLDDKSKETNRTYENVYYDSKDAEIYELLRQERAKNIELPRYKSLRGKMGGGGGYATPFFKLGDIGLTQMKFFSNKNAIVNFARFSLIRDRFSQLENILSGNDASEIGFQLMKFFTEKESSVSNGITTIVNQEAKEEFMKIFRT